MKSREAHSKSLGEKQEMALKKEEALKIVKETANKKELADKNMKELAHQNKKAADKVVADGEAQKSYKEEKKSKKVIDDKLKAVTSRASREAHSKSKSEKSLGEKQEMALKQ